MTTRPATPPTPLDAAPEREPPISALRHKDLLGISDLTSQEILLILDTADAMREIVILADRREGLEDGRFIRIVDMRLDLAARLGSQFAHQAVQHAERLQIVTLLGHRLLEGLENGLASVLHGGDRVGDEEGAEGGAADDDGLPGLDQHVQMPAHRHEAAEHATECDDKSDQNSHGAPSTERQSATTSLPALCEA